MKFTQQWLLEHLHRKKEYAAQEDITEELLIKLTDIGLEVEENIDYRKIFDDKFIVAEIISAERHPNADRLQVCRVNDGLSGRTIVCGAQNARAGIKVALATIDARIPNGDFLIRRSKIRGVESEGMMCSKAELSFDTSKKYAFERDDIGNSGDDGIIELRDDAPIGMNLGDYMKFNDVMFDVSMTPNRRRDSCGVRFIANELYGTASFGKMFDYCPQTYGKIELIDDIREKIRSTLISKGEEFDQANGNFEIIFAYITDISQNNLYDRALYQNISSYLEKIKGQNSLPLVNISNFMMFDYGRPNHIYDADKVFGHPIVRRSRAGEKFISIKDGVEMILPDGCLVIADDEKILAIAGVMGDSRSKVDKNTQNIIIEVASFPANDVRISGRLLNISTDSRKLFENELGNDDIENFTIDILACAKQICGGMIDKITRHRGFDKRDKEVSVNGENMEISRIQNDEHNMSKFLVNLSDVLEIIGDEAISIIEIEHILQRLGYLVERMNDDIDTMRMITVPFRKRVDIRNKYGLADELVRMIGAGNIASKMMNLSSIVMNDKNGVGNFLNGNNYATLNDPNFRRELIQRCHSMLNGRGLDEVSTLSLISEEKAGDWLYPGSRMIKIDNPLNETFACLRPSLICELVEFAKTNILRGIERCGVYEIGNIHYVENSGGKSGIDVMKCEDLRSNNDICKYGKFDRLSIAGVRMGYMSEYNVGSKKCADYFDVRDDLFAVLKACGMSDEFSEYRFIYDLDLLPKNFHPKKTTAILYRDIVLGYCGELHPKFLQKYKISHPICAWEINLERVIEKCNEAIKENAFKNCDKYSASSYQRVNRDFSFLCANGIFAGDIVRVIREMRMAEIIDVSVIDFYDKSCELELNDEGCKRYSITIRVVFQSQSKTLDNEEIEKFVYDIIHGVDKKLGCTVI